MTARIHLLSPDIRRPGRVGDLIIPVLDPEDDDRREFLKWVISGVLLRPPRRTLTSWTNSRRDILRPPLLRSARQLKAKGCKTIEEVVAVVEDQILPAIGQTRSIKPCKR